jgi:hypothetical protein
MNKSRLLVLACCALALSSLPACVLVPEGDGHDGGRDHEHRDDHDGGEHRHDFGVELKEHLGLDAPHAHEADAAVVDSQRA